jgi:hypothetical protein
VNSLTTKSIASSKRVASAPARSWSIWIGTADDHAPFRSRLRSGHGVPARPCETESRLSRFRIRTQSGLGADR